MARSTWRLKKKKKKKDRGRRKRGEARVVSVWTSSPSSSSSRLKKKKFVFFSPPLTPQQKKKKTETSSTYGAPLTGRNCGRLLQLLGSHFCQSSLGPFCLREREHSVGCFWVCVFVAVSDEESVAEEEGQGRGARRHIEAISSPTESVSLIPLSIDLLSSERTTDKQKRKQKPQNQKKPRHRGQLRRGKATK